MKKNMLIWIIILIAGAIFILPKIQQTFIVQDFTCNTLNYAQSPGNYDCYRPGYTTCKQLVFQDPKKSSRCYMMELAYNFNPNTDIIDYYMYYSRNLWIYQSPSPLAPVSCVLGDSSTPGSEVTCTGEIVSSYSSTTSPNPHTGSISVSPSSRYFKLVAADKGHPSTGVYYGAILAIDFKRDTCLNNADTNCDGKVDFNELVSYAKLWVNNQGVTFQQLITVANAWTQ